VRLAGNFQAEGDALGIARAGMGSSRFKRQSGPYAGFRVPLLSGNLPLMLRPSAVPGKNTESG
jgi:hypothetical protein